MIDLSQIPARSRQVLILLIFEHKTPDECAAQLGITIEQVCRLYVSAVRCIRRAG